MWKSGYVFFLRAGGKSVPEMSGKYYRRLFGEKMLSWSGKSLLSGANRPTRLSGTDGAAGLSGTDGATGLSR